MMEYSGIRFSSILTNSRILLPPRYQLGAHQPVSCYRFDENAQIAADPLLSNK